MNLGNLTVKIGADLSGLSAGIEQAGAKMNKLGTDMTKVGTTMTASITAPLLAIGTAAFNLHKGFESSLSKVTGLVGVASDQVKAWGNEILRIAPALGKAPEELADALFFVTSAGLKGAEAMDVLKASAQASVAGLGETKVIADLVTSAMNAYGKENLSAAAATDILVASVREGKAEATELAGAMGQVLPIAAEMQISFDQVGAAIAAMTRTGTNAAEASTQLKAIMSSLLAPSQQAEEALQGMGTSAANLRKQIREEGLIATLGSLRTLTNQYGEDAMGKVFPNIRALSGVLDLMGSNASDNIQVFDSLKNATGSLSGAFKAAAETTQFKFDQAIIAVKTSLTQFGATLSEAVTPLIQEFAAWIQKLGNWFNSLSQAQKESVIKWAALAAGIGPVLIIMGKVVSAISMLAPLFAALTGPIGLVIAAIAALAAGILYIWDNWEAVKERISDISWWKNAILQMVQWLIKYSPINLLIEGVNLLLEKFGKDKIPNPFEAMQEGLESLKDETKEYEHQFGSFSDAMKHGMEAVSGLLGFDGLGGGAGSAIAPLVPTDEQMERMAAMPPMLEQTQDVMINTKELIDETGMMERATPTLEQVERMRLWTEELAFMSNGITNAVNGAITDAAIGVGTMIGQFASGASKITSFGGLVKSMGVVVMEAVAGLAQQIGMMAIESGVALLAIKIGLNSLNPAIMIGAGVALVALSSAIKAKSSAMSKGFSSGGGDAGASNLQGLATGGTVTSAGAFMVGERGPEMVTLPAGAAVTPNHMLGSGGSQQQLIAKVTGRDLDFILQQYYEDSNRIS